jgi:hypothetical protein
MRPVMESEGRHLSEVQMLNHRGNLLAEPVNQVDGMTVREVSRGSAQKWCRTSYVAMIHRCSNCAQSAPRLSESTSQWSGARADNETRAAS